MLGAILSGGQNRRFGSDKAFISLGGELLIVRIIAALQGLFSELVIITNTPERYKYLGLTTLKDIIPGKGCLGGIYTAMRHAKDGSAFAVACDMPFVNRKFVEYMLENTEGYDLVIPRAQALQPLHAIYRAPCLPHIEALMEEGNLRILDFFHKISIREVGPEEVARFDPHGIMFYNINTPEDLAEAKTFIQ